MTAPPAPGPRPPAPIRLKTLLYQRHWQTYHTFCDEYDKAVVNIDPRLVGSWPSRAQFRRWLSGAVRGLPYPHHCRVLEAMFPGLSAEEIFGRTPSESNPAISRATGAAANAMPIPAPGPPDIVQAYAMRGLITRPAWNEIIRSARHHIWLYGMAEMGYALDDEVPSIIRAAAERGADIRVLLLDPQYVGLQDIDADEGNPPGTLAPRIRAALRRFSSMREGLDNINIRVYDGPPTASIVRGDERMLVTPYLRFFAGSNTPTFELKSNPEGFVFNRYVRHFENIWNPAKELTP